jgi:hypothetical protein
MASSSQAPRPKSSVATATVPKYKEKKVYKELKFADFPTFRPNLTPNDMFQLGSFGGTYWRPILSDVTGKQYKNKHAKYDWAKNIPAEKMTLPWDKYNKSINKHNVKVGTTLEYWESKGWITKHHPYGWVQWYCDFYEGKRGPEDERQIARWVHTAGTESRFRKRLENMVSDDKDSPKIRQTLQHWAVIV